MLGRAALVFFCLTFGLAPSELDYYRLHFEKKPPHPLADTLFQKTIWHKKVSNIVIEERPEHYLVTILAILPYPANWKSQNYALHYRFKTFDKAFAKLRWLNSFLRAGGVVRVKILGSEIKGEKILYQPPNQPARDAAENPGRS